ncbi:N-acetylmuramoyl-L-alanine amidase [Actinoplanes aureus]|uniref:N-acetylmuramoyl-L-alanine amidase n=1 Tax=Actinoplanes aureus TaxID=2792083 RepID=A0A931C7Z2_9ACTN|nr:N-acetylmuramoyl-L-alanine amidase [Actinoplanes aureus]MBG0562148.1 N-acetylmuramoyl-L-alanine amidase [Actinoplanes aureus]
MQRRVAIGIGAAVAVLAAGGGVAVLTLTSGPAETAAAAQDGVTVLPPDPNAEPPRIPTDLHTVDIAGSGGSAEVPQRDTKRFSLLGVTWADPKDKPEASIEVRTRGVKSGKWSDWQALEPSDIGPDGAEAAATARRGGTEPLWVGPADGVAARIAGSGSGLPAGLRLDLIDPGTEPGGRGGGEPDPSASAPAPEPSTGTPESSEPAPGPSAEPEAPPASQPAPPPSAIVPPSLGPAPSAPASTGPSTVPTTTTVVPTSTVPVKAQFPLYYSRRTWSADERIVGSIEVAKEVKLLWVHHTATTNSYECTESPAIVRGIQAYHVKSNGWSDVGYNYLMDKCGRLYEGRRGGVENAVVGAHTQGFNTNYAAVSVIGNYESAKSNPAIELTIAQLAAARLGKYNYNPTSKVTVVAGSTNGKYKAGTRVTLPRVSGHRDADATACPGANLYSRLAAIRGASQQMITGLALRSVTGGGSAGGVWFVRNKAQLTWSLTTPAAQVARIEVQVDGKTVSTLPGTALTAAVTLTPGKHTVVIRPVHVSGSSARLTATIWGDVTAPSTPGGLAVGLSTGTVSKTAVPVVFGFSAADNAGLGGYVISRPRAGSAPATARSWATTARLGATTYTVTARDLAGNVGRTASVSRSVLLSSEGSAKKTGTWSKKSGNGYLGDKALSARTKNRKLAWTFTGRSAALLFTKNSSSGKVAIYVDGKKLSTVDLKSKKTLNRQAVWTRSLPYGKHKIEIVVLGTSGRPTVISDGLLYVK